MRSPVSELELFSSTGALLPHCCGVCPFRRHSPPTVITHNNDFCERQPYPTRTTNSWTANLVFANSHIILPSIWLVLFAAMSFRNIGRKMSGALKKVTGSSSSRSSSHRSSTPRQATLIKMSKLSPRRQKSSQYNKKKRRRQMTPTSTFEGSENSKRTTS